MTSAQNQDAEKGYTWTIKQNPSPNTPNAAARRGHWWLEKVFPMSHETSLAEFPARGTFRIRSGDRSDSRQSDEEEFLVPQAELSFEATGGFRFWCPFKKFYWRLIGGGRVA